MTCPQCGYVKPRKPPGRPKLYEVEDMTVGELRSFPYRDKYQRKSIRSIVHLHARRTGKIFTTRSSGDRLRVTREA